MSTKNEASEARFAFIKGGENVVAPKAGQPFEWAQAAAKVRESLNDAMNARHIAFLLGSGCSSLIEDGRELGIPTMAPLAKEFHAGTDESKALTAVEKEQLKALLGLDTAAKEFSANLERLLEVLFGWQFVLARSESKALAPAKSLVATAINKTKLFITDKCQNGEFARGNDKVTTLYQSFYRKLLYRDRSLPRPWIFTTNYDLFNERAMDRLGSAYCNGFSGTVERRFNPSSFRYALAEQLDVSSRKWTTVDGYIYLCKLHGSINWIEEGEGLFPIRELQEPPADTKARMMIYPTPMKQNASFGSPYADLIREFQGRIVREQSVLFTIGYNFGDEHINNIIFQALTVPSFRLVVLLKPSLIGVPAKLRHLRDPRVWIIGGDGPQGEGKAHYLNNFVEHFMPEPPGDKVDTAIERVLERLVSASNKTDAEGGGT